MSATSLLLALTLSLGPFLTLATDPLTWSGYNCSTDLRPKDPTWFWLNSSTSQCFCRTRYGIECRIGEKRKGYDIPCSSVRHDSVEVSLHCDKLRRNEQVLLFCLMQFFHHIRILYIDNCLINYDGYGVNRHGSEDIQWSSFFSRRRGRGSPFALYLKANQTLRYKLNWTRPNCSLYHLTIARSRMFVLPIGFLSMCYKLETLSLAKNDLTILDTNDFASIVSLPRLMHLNLSHNYLTEIASVFMGDAMREVLRFMKHNLTSWIKENNTYLEIFERNSLMDLSRKFEDWSSNADKLHFQDLVRYAMEAAKTNLTIDFVMHRASLTHLCLNNNSFKHIPLVLFGYSNLTQLRMSHNKVKYAFVKSESFLFFAFRHSLQTLELDHNEIRHIDDDGMGHLQNLETLDLNINQITYMSPKAFPTGNKLKFLYLQHNQIDVLSFETQMNNLVIMNVSYNIIEKLNENLSDNLLQIWKLFLDGNPFRSLSPFSLGKLTNLIYLGLTNCSLKDMRAATYKMDTKKPSRSDRAIVDIRYGNKGVLCDCLSVFPELLWEYYKSINFDYPFIFYTDNQTCKLGDDSHPVTIKNTRMFRCFFQDKLCGYNCTCCNDLTHNCECQWKCPSKCWCSHTLNYTGDFTYEFTDFYVDCSDQNHQFVPRLSFKADAMFLENTNIQAINTNNFPSATCSEMKTLSLAGNQISVLGKHAFHGLTSLTSLNLSSNNIYSVHPETFIQLPNLETLYACDTGQKHLQWRPFANLTNLNYLNLEKNPLVCDCDNLMDFLHHRKNGGTNGALRIDMPNNCTAEEPIGSSSITLDDLQKRCEELQKQKNDRRALFVWRLRAALIGGGCMLGLVFLLLLVSHQRYRLRAALDLRVRSALARTLLSLSPLNRHCNIDVAFLVHERQTEHYRDMRRRLQASPRHGLRTVWLADHMPGALRLSAVADVASDVAACVVLLSIDLLDDNMSAEMLRVLLSRFVEDPKDSPAVFVPILLSSNVTTHASWPAFSVLLRHWPILTWRQPFFWERLMTALPAPTPGPRADGYEQEASLVELEPQTRQLASTVPVLAQLCVVSDDRQKDVLVRRLFDRYRGGLSLCSLRERHLYGLPASTQQHSLNAVFALCSQILVVVSPELLSDPWTAARLAPALTARYESFPFRGTVVFLELNTAVAHMSREPRFLFYDCLRAHNLAVTLSCAAVEANWDLLSRHLVDLDEAAAAMEAMDEAEFSHLLCSTASRLSDADQLEVHSNIFEQHRVRNNNG